MSQIRVVRKNELGKGAATPGVVREKAFDSGKVVVSRTRLDSGAVSGWHHHGRRELYLFVVQGILTLESEPGQGERVALSKGDFASIPPGHVHRDLNEGGGPLIVVNVLVGEGELVVNVGRPDTPGTPRPARSV